MATGNVAEIGFRADTNDLAKAEAQLDALPPAAGRAERASQRLTAIFGKLDATADKLAAAATGLSTAADKMAAAIGKAAAASTRKGKAANDAAAATKKETAAAEAAAAAARKEAAAVEAAAKAHEHNAAAKRRSARVPSIAGGSVSPRPGPWGGMSDNDNMPNGRTPRDGILAAQSSPSNIAAQFQDIGVTAAMGMNPLLIALQQGTQLSMAFAGGVQGVGAALKMMLGPTALITIALVAIGAALLQAVDWTKLAQSVLNGLASTLEALGPYIVAAAAALALIYAPQIIAGIVLVIAWISRMGVAVMTTATQIAAGWIIAMGPVAWVIAGIAAIVTAAIIFRDEIAKIFGVDIVGYAKTGINMVIGAFVGGFNGIKKTWQALPAAIGDVMINVGNLVLKAFSNTINRMIGLLNGLVTYLPAWMRPEGDLITWRADFEGFENQFKGSAARIGDTIRGEIDNAIGTDYVGMIGSAVSNTISGVADKIRSLSSGLGQSDDKKKKKGGGKTDAEKFDDIINGADRAIASLQAEAAAIGMNELAAAKLKHETDLLNEAKQKNITLSKDQRDQLIAVAHGMAELEIANKRAREALELSKDLFKGFLTDLREGLAQGKSFWESFGDAALNVLNKIADKLLNDVVDAIFEVMKAGQGGGGWLGSLFSWIGGLFKFAKGGTFSNGISGHSNTVVDRPTLFAFASGAGIMGEAGPEAIMPLKRGPDGSLGVQMYSGNKSSDSGDGLNITYAPQYNVAQGADPKAIAELRKAQEEDRRNFKNNVADAVVELRQRAVDI